MPHLSFTTHTWIWVLQPLFETWESRSEGIRKLNKDLVHGEYAFLPEVGLARGHQRQDVVSEIPRQEKATRRNI